MSFHNVSLPDGFQYGSVFGAGFNTTVQGTASGHEVRLARQAQARHRFTLIKALQSKDEAAALKIFAMARRGALHSFRLKDWSDYTTAADGVSAPTNLDQVIAVGDGVTQSFQIFKWYDLTGPAPYVRPITLPATTPVYTINGVPTAASTSVAGVATFASPPLIGTLVTMGCEFDVPVRFSQDYDTWAQMRADAFRTWTKQNMECVEVLNEVEWPELWNPGGWEDHGAVSADLTISYAGGMGHSFAPSAAINVFLPAPSRSIGGPRHFVIENKAGSASTLQMRTDAGVALGAVIAAGVIRRIGLRVSGSTATWVIY